VGQRVVYYSQSLAKIVLYQALQIEAVTRLKGCFKVQEGRLLEQSLSIDFIIQDVPSVILCFRYVYEENKYSEKFEHEKKRKKKKKRKKDIANSIVRMSLY
jgi:hypothetical protein